MSLLTPSFAASQDDDQVRILIHLSRSHLGREAVDALGSGPQSSDEAAPSSGSPSSPIGVVAQGNIFGFRCDPYYLPLVFPGDLASTPPPSWRIAETGEGSADLVVEVTAPKANAGQDFVGLDELQAQYLPENLDGAAQSTSGPAPPGFAGGASSREEETGLINQMLGRAMAKEGLMDDESMAAPSTDGVTEVHAQASMSTSTRASARPSRPPRLPVVPFGARSRCHKLFLSTEKAATAATASAGSAVGSLLLDEAETQYRSGFSERMEDEKWDEAWYLDNYVDEAGEIGELLHWTDSRLTASSAAQGRSDRSLESLKLDDASLQLLLLLVELLFAHAYDRRTTMGDASVESGWTLAMLSRSLVCACPPALSSDVASSLRATLRASYRRALSMPLYRRWDLAQKVQEDVAHVLGSGMGGVSQALIEVETALSGASDEDQAMAMYLEQLVGPMGAWVRESVEEASLLALSQAVSSLALSKDQVGGQAWDLEALEEAAEEALAEQQQRVRG